MKKETHSLPRWTLGAIAGALIFLFAVTAFADRQTLTKSTAPGKYASTGVCVTQTEADTSNKDQFLSTGNDLVLAHNTGGSDHTVTITSVADSYGRTGNISQLVTAGNIYAFGPFPQTAWMQTGGYIYLEADSTDVDFSVITLPGTP